MAPRGYPDDRRRGGRCDTPFRHCAGLVVDVRERHGFRRLVLGLLVGVLERATGGALATASDEPGQERCALIPPGGTVDRQGRKTFSTGAGLLERVRVGAGLV